MRIHADSFFEQAKALFCNNDGFVCTITAEKE
jgi:hypothetical protein